MKYFSTCVKNVNNKTNISSLPYCLGGLKFKNFTPKQKFDSGEEFFNFVDENNKEKEKTFFSFLRTDLKMSNEFKMFIDRQCKDYVNNLFLISKGNQINTETSKLKCDTKLFDNFSKNVDLNLKIEENSLKNKFFLNRIFVHFNLNKHNVKHSHLKKVENIFSKRLVLFNYGSNVDEENLNRKSNHIVVRFSIWAKLSNCLLVEDLIENNKELENFLKYKIYEDEWHHLLFQLEGDSSSLNYLDVLNQSSFPKLISKFLFSKEKALNIYENLKLVDFDFHLAGNPLTESEEYYNKNDRIVLAISWYEQLLTAYPIKTKIVTASGIYGLGDYLCQLMENKYLRLQNKINIKRILMQSAFGIVVAPYLHLQYCIIIPRLFKESSKWFALASTAYAVTISDSLFNLSYFYYMEYTSNKKHKIQSEMSSEVMQKFIPVQIMNMKVWPFLTGFNFYYVPAMYRVLFDNFASIFWMIYLSYIEHNTGANKKI